MRWSSISIFLFIILTPYLLSGQVDSAKLKRSLFSGFPIVFYSPETNWGFGGVGIYTFHFHSDSIQSRPSKIQIGFAYTLNKQVLFYLPFQIFYKNAQWNFYGELGYYKYSYNFYGIGNNQPEDYVEKYRVNYPRIRINVLRKIYKGISAGMRYWYENDKIISLETGKQLASNTIVGSKGGRISGAGIVLNYDTRNDLFFPSNGIIVESSYQFFQKKLGSNFNFSRLTIDASGYYSPGKHHVIAANFVFENSSGTVPFNYLALLGGTKRMRGYYEGRYRDKNLLLFQMEYRAMLWKRFGAAVFGGMSGVANNISDFTPNIFHFDYGAGLRFKLSKKENVNVRLDAGFGRKTSGIYLTIGEAF
jgi:outer membrane protein assembly factor BamA